MARPSRPKAASVPVPPPPALLPTDILTGPAQFAARLSATEVRPQRFVGVVLLSALLSGVAYALLVAPAANLAAQAVENGPPVLLTHLTNAFGGLFLGVLTSLVLWGVGHLCARGPGRAAEVYGATFSLLPPLYALVMVLTLLLPPPGLAEQMGGAARQIERAALHVTAHTPAALALYAVSLLGTAAQGALAYPAFRALTGEPGRAALASTLPLLPALAVQLLGLAPLLFNR